MNQLALRLNPPSVRDSRTSAQQPWLSALGAWALLSSWTTHSPGR